MTVDFRMAWMNLYLLNMKLYQKIKCYWIFPAFLYDCLSYLLSPKAVPETNLPFSLVALGRWCPKLRHPATWMPRHFIWFLGCGGAEGSFLAQPAFPALPAIHPLAKLALDSCLLKSAAMHCIGCHVYQSLYRNVAYPKKNERYF